MNYSIITGGIITIAFLLSVSAVIAVEPSAIYPSIKVSNTSQPYEDQAFQERADYVIKNLTNPLPKDNNLMELQSAYYELVKKNVKPEFYGEAKNITQFIFYDLKAGEGMQEYKDTTHTANNRIESREDVGNQAYADLDAAKQAWKKISHRYPDFTPDFLTGDGRSS